MSTESMESGMWRKSPAMDSKPSIDTNTPEKAAEEPLPKQLSISQGQPVEVGFAESSIPSDSES